MTVRLGEGLSVCWGEDTPRPLLPGNLVRDGTGEDISNYWRVREARGRETQNLKLPSLQQGVSLLRVSNNN